jgi:hypothetical protein
MWMAECLHRYLVLPADDAGSEHLRYCRGDHPLHRASLRGTHTRGALGGTLPALHRARRREYHRRPFPGTLRTHCAPWLRHPRRYAALILFLLVSFVGIGVALVLAALYALFLILSYIYAGILAGAALARGSPSATSSPGRKRCSACSSSISSASSRSRIPREIHAHDGGRRRHRIAGVRYAFRRNQVELPLE